MAVEVRALVLAFDYVYVIRDAIAKLLGRDIEIEAYHDNRTVFNVNAKDGTTAERCPQIDLTSLITSYVREQKNKTG